MNSYTALYCFYGAERKVGGQPGIISCMAMHPVMTGMFALGSYSCSGNHGVEYVECPVCLTHTLTYVHTRAHNSMLEPFVFVINVHLLFSWTLC